MIGGSRRLLVAYATGEAHEDSRGTYGYRRVQAALRLELDLTVNHKFVAKFMADLGLTGLPRKKTWKRNLIGVRTSTDLVNRNFTATGPNQLWVTDISEHSLIEGTVYACVVLDVTLRKTVGIAVDRRPETSLVNSALLMAHSSRQSAAGQSSMQTMEPSSLLGHSSVTSTNLGFNTAWDLSVTVTTTP